MKRRPTKSKPVHPRRIDDRRLDEVTGGDHGTIIIYPNGSVWVIRDEGA